MNASGRSPAGWNPKRFAGLETMPHRGWESVTVPGAVSAWVELSSRFGRLPFETLFEPAIAYARDGYHVSPLVARLWKSEAALLSGQPGFADCFIPSGRVPAAGDLFRNIALADSLQEVALTKGTSFLECAPVVGRDQAAFLTGVRALRSSNWMGLR